jgi:hypothetical protein
LHAINIRTNHVHIVTYIKSSPPERALRDFKAYSTKALRLAGLWSLDHGPWSDGGSTRYLWKEDAVAEACNYVAHGQGRDLTNID